MKKIYSILGLLAMVGFSNAQIVINEAYGGGGNSGADLKQDFVELKNIGSSSVTLSGAYLWYGTSSGSTFSLSHAIPDITLSAGQTYLIGLKVGTGGTIDLPTPDYSPASPMNLSASAFKLVLTSDSTSPTSPTDSNVLDFLGVGSANQYEGSGAAPSSSNTTSVARTSGDTNDNSVDFAAGTPTPTNSSGATLGISELTNVTKQLVKATLIDDKIVFTTNAEVKIVNMNGQLVKSASVKKDSSLDVSGLANGVYVVVGTVDGKTVSQKIIKK